MIREREQLSWSGVFALPVASLVARSRVLSSFVRIWRWNIWWKRKYFSDSLPSLPSPQDQLKKKLKSTYAMWIFSHHHSSHTLAMFESRDQRQIVIDSPSWDFSFFKKKKRNLKNVREFVNQVIKNASMMTSLCFLGRDDDTWYGYDKLVKTCKSKYLTVRIHFVQQFTLNVRQMKS